ncbi:MAG TPA: Holliday junction branch migration protein RuvA [Acidothermaceae bacterium]|nr:Holliday junction branch migration protein RuvA [Acidothermaceae bacterium]
MISFVSGRVAAIAPDSVVVEVGGFGVQLMCAPTTIAKARVGEPARFATSLVVREDSLTLYGFSDDDERTVFELLQTASGVGPRLAQAMLGVHPPAALRRAVASDDFAALAMVPGIGKKTAQRIVLELKDKLAGATLTDDIVVLPSGGSAPWRESVHSALLGLGYSVREADDAVLAISSDANAIPADGGTPDVSALLRIALRSLGRV